jgi:hypothetical protein
MLSLINFEKGRAKHGHVDASVLVSTLQSVSLSIVSFVFEKQREGRGHEVKVELIVLEESFGEEQHITQWLLVFESGHELHTLQF